MLPPICGTSSRISESLAAINEKVECVLEKHDHILENRSNLDQILQTFATCFDYSSTHSLASDPIEVLKQTIPNANSCLHYSIAIFLLHAIPWFFSTFLFRPCLSPLLAGLVAGSTSGLKAVRASSFSSSLSI